MITAVQARANVTKFESEEYARVSKIVEELLPAISQGVEYHSQQGLSETIFHLYTEPYIPFLDRQLASEILERTLISNGYQIIQNDHQRNVLKFRW